MPAPRWFFRFMYDRESAALERRHDEPEHRELDERTADEFAHVVAPPGPVADLGCGPGAHALALARLGYDVVGLDGSPRMVEAARARAARDEVDATFDVHDVSAPLHFADASLGGVLAILVIQHLPHPAAFIAEIRRCLRPGGHLLIIAPARGGAPLVSRNRYWRLRAACYQVVPGLVRFYDTSSLTRLVEGQGLTVVECNGEGPRVSVLAHALRCSPFSNAPSRAVVLDDEHAGPRRSVFSSVVAIVDRFRKKPEIELTAELVRELLRDQQPDLADRPLTLGARGWDNQLWRLGDDLAVRLPWQTETADALLLKENTWLPVLAPLLPLPVPVPQRLGRPSARYPHPWIVTTWVPGTPADRAPATCSGPAADALAAFLTALHRPAPVGAPEGLGRGGPLTQVAKSVARQFDAMTDLYTAVAKTEQEPTPDPDTVRAIWDDAVSAPGWEGPPLWLHGDLHPANVLTADGNFCGVVDFGDLCAGDPALDVAACWILLPDQEAIERFQAAYPPAMDDATWRRARGWAVWRALGSLGIAAAGHPGGKPSWGPPALASLQRLTASVA